MAGGNGILRMMGCVHGKNAKRQLDGTVLNVWLGCPVEELDVVACFNLNIR